MELEHWWGLSRWVRLAAAGAALNLSLTFANVWPTLAVHPTVDLSLEATLCVLGFVVARGVFQGSMANAVRWGAALWLLLIVGRYAEVTTTSLYGRDINFYWDTQHMPSVGAMFAFVADPWLKAGVVAALLLAPLLLYGATWSVLTTIAEATQWRRMRLALGGVAGTVLVVGVTTFSGYRVFEWVRFADPILPAFARELREYAYEASGAGLRDLGAAPAWRSDLSRVQGADVLVVFLESYGAVSWSRPEFVEALAPVRSRFTDAIETTGRNVMSAFVESTTFGGESWLAHISLLSGTEVRDQGTNVRLMAQERDTLVKVFGRGGYRTVAIVPGILVSWPEGAFYGFDQIYDHERLDYRGPPFGWWGVNDQYSLARVDAVEIAPEARPPAFVFFTTITTHAPFVPTPPYQADWTRVLSETPYDDEALDRAWSAWPDWMNLGPSYLTAFEYAFDYLGGYLQLRADRDLVMILVGDHQPPALVSGEGASWDVPVHVIASRPGVLERLEQRHAFTSGLTPAPETVARMDTLLPILLDAFGDRMADTDVAPVGVVTGNGEPEENVVR